MHSAIFNGQVSHARKSPLAHAFTYDVSMAYLDLDELDSVFERRWFWSTKRPSLVRFRRADYFGNPEEPLADSIRSLVESRTGSRPTGPIRLLTHLSWFGYCFNPISLYYCFDDAGQRVATIVAEVRNTPWGERCCYVLSDPMNRGDDETHRYSTAKDMHVSPFMGMDVDYDWLLTVPGEDLVVRINNRSGRKRFFNATLILKRHEISGRTLAGTLVRYPLMAIKVTLAIYWQAFRLWLKGCPIYTHPDKKKSLQVHS